MKKLFILAFICFTSLTYSQKITTKIPAINSTIALTGKDVKRVFNLDIKVPKTMEQQIGKATITNNVAIYKTINYPVYITEKGKLFIVYPVKDNKVYSKKYIKE